jgi:hypothetical protein
VRHALTLAAAALLAATGCRAEPAMVQVEGTVSYRGKPLTNGMINFEPTDPARANDAASALIGPDGRYRLRTRKPGDGIAPGSYRVAVRSDRDPAGSGASAVPPEYESADRSPLTAEVAPAPEKQTIDFTVADPRPGAKSLPRLPE